MGVVGPAVDEVVDLVVGEARRDIGLAQKGVSIRARV
jgi:hypothetical protein